MADFNAPESRNEAILQNMLGANNVLPEPQSRNEKLLLKLLGEDVEIEEPQSRIEELLTLLIEQGGVGGDRDWKEIGYAKEPDFIEEGFAYAKQIKDSWDPSNTTRLFKNDTNLVFMPMVETGQYTAFNNMFYQCYSLAIVPLLNTSNVATMQNMFSYCGTLKEIPNFDTGKVTTMQYMFRNCYSIKSVPLLDTSNVESMGSMFLNCFELETIPIFNTEKLRTANYWFSVCPKLSDESLNNILAMCINATAFIDTKTLSNLGLDATQKTKCQSLSNWDAFVAAGWSA